MHITQWGEYGVHCAIFIAKHAAQPGTPAKAIKASEIAEAQKIPTDYAQQILQRLRNGDIITSVRGPLGGYCLARPAEEITLKDILSATEGDTFDVICEAKPLADERCSAGAPCTLRPIWHGLKQHINQYLTQFTLAQLVTSKISLATATDSPIQINTHQAS